MRFAGFLQIHSWNANVLRTLPLHPLHQGEKQPDSELFLRAVPFILNCLLERLGERGGGKGRREL